MQFWKSWKIRVPTMFCRIDVAHYLQQHPAPSGRELKSWNASWEVPNVMFWKSWQSGSQEVWNSWHVILQSMASYILKQQCLSVCVQCLSVCVQCLSVCVGSAWKILPVTTRSPEITHLNTLNRAFLTVSVFGHRS
jgi:hypothetical protein